MEKYFASSIRTLADEFINEVKARGGKEMCDSDLFFDAETVHQINAKEEATPRDIFGNSYTFFFDYHAFELNGFNIEVRTMLPKNDDGLIISPRSLMPPLIYHKDKPNDEFNHFTPFVFAIHITEKGHLIFSMRLNDSDDFSKIYSEAFEKLDKVAPIN